MSEVIFLRQCILENIQSLMKMVGKLIKLGRGDLQWSIAKERIFLKDFIYLFLEREEWREMERERNVMWDRTMGCLLYAPWLGPEPATQACALTGNRARDLLLGGMMPNQLSHAGQGVGNHFWKWFSKSLGKSGQIIFCSLPFCMDMQCRFSILLEGKKYGTDVPKHFFKDFIYLFLEREKERERNMRCINRLPLTHPQPRPVPWLGIDLSVSRLTLNPMSYNRQGPNILFNTL